MISAKEYILEHDFVEVLEYLQHAGRQIDVNEALHLSRELYE
jgi:hypothetical protein